MHNIFVFVDPDTSVKKNVSASQELANLPSGTSKYVHSVFLTLVALIEFGELRLKELFMLVIQIYGLGFKNWMICWVLGVGPKVGLLGYLEVYVMMIFNIEYLQGSTFDFYSLPKKHTS